jgi:hypothetical protein
MNNTYIYILLSMMLNIKNIFLTTSLSFLFGFYSLCHLFVYIKRIEDVGTQNRRSFEEVNIIMNDYEYKFNKLQFEVVSLRSEIDKLKKVVRSIQKNVDGSSFISPLSVSSLGTLDISIDENDNSNTNGITCDELCDFNKELIEIRSKGTSFDNTNSISNSFNTNLVDDSNFDLNSDYYDNNSNEKTNELVNNNLENISSKKSELDLNQMTSSVESINYLKSIFGYEMIEEANNNYQINNNNYQLTDNNHQINNNDQLTNNVYNNYNYDDLEVNRIVKDDNSIGSHHKKRSLSVSDVNWVGITKKFIFG